jgi:hypothetical protein
MNAEQLQEIVERIMTQHWDLAACPCWVCSKGREAGCRPREKYLSAGEERLEFVNVDGRRES